MTDLDAAREVVQRRIDNSLDAMPPRARARTEISVVVPIDALRTLVAATAPPTEDERETLAMLVWRAQFRVEYEWEAAWHALPDGLKNVWRGEADRILAEDGFRVRRVTL